MQSYTTASGCKWRVLEPSVYSTSRCTGGSGAVINHRAAPVERRKPPPDLDFRQVWNYNPDSTLVHTDTSRPPGVVAEIGSIKNTRLPWAAAQKMLRSLKTKFQRKCDRQPDRAHL